MKSMRIPIHSVIDVITNSSSVIYTEATNNAISLIKGIINTVLEAAGSDKTADDLYNFRLIKRPQDVSDWLAYVNTSEFTGHRMAQFIPEIEKIQATDWRERISALNHFVRNHTDELNEFFDTVDTSRYNEGTFLQELIVTTKDGTELPFSSNLMAMFNSWESYN